MVSHGSTNNINENGFNWECDEMKGYNMFAAMSYIDPYLKHMQGLYDYDYGMGIKERIPKRGKHQSYRNNKRKNRY